jgi:pyruvate carboxylase
VPTVPGTEHGLESVAEVKKAAKEIGYPVIIKASFGGGGRGMRVVQNADELQGKLEEAQREAGAAFGRPEVFVEKYIQRAKHIEVQILGDTHGNLVHLWERDCSVQRRHQKVVEVAPSINLRAELREKICDAAVRLTKTPKYRNAGTASSCSTPTPASFIHRVNPRIQVEHTVRRSSPASTSCAARSSSRRGSSSTSRRSIFRSRTRSRPAGYAIQCRITTEDPENQFIPDYGRLSTYDRPADIGLRLDGGNGFAERGHHAYFDSLLVKLTSSGATFDER